MDHHEAFKAKFPKIYVPAESLEAYKTASNWSVHASRIIPMTKSMRLNIHQDKKPQRPLR